MMREESKGIFMGIGMTLFVLGFLQMTAIIEGDSDEIYLKHIEQALEVCEGNDGLYMIDGEWAHIHHFRCRNGAVFTYDSRKDAEE